MNAQSSALNAPVYRQTPAAQLLGVADHIELVATEVVGSRRRPSIVYETFNGDKRTGTLKLQTSTFKRIDADTARFNSEERCESSGDLVTWYSDKHGNFAVFVQRNPGKND